MSLPERHEDIVAGFHRLYNRARIVSGTMLMPVTLARKFPNRTAIEHMEDFDHLCRLYESGEVKFHNVPEVLYRYNILPKGTIARPEYIEYNAFIRALRRQRCKGREEWPDIEMFRTYLAHHPGERLCWRTLRLLMAVKLRVDNLRFFARLCSGNAAELPGGTGGGEGSV